MKKLYLLFSTLFFSVILCAQSVQLKVGNKAQFPLSPHLYGIFFEDINYGADGGWYAEMLKNRNFEFPYGLQGWAFEGDVRIASEKPCYVNNPHYVRMQSPYKKKNARIENEGFVDGMGVKEGETYVFTCMARTSRPQAQILYLEIIGSDGQVIGSAQTQIAEKRWKYLRQEIVPTKTDAHARFRITAGKRTAAEQEFHVDLDMVSLFPQKTWKNRGKGLRKDISQALADLTPRVFRFPGGCIIEGHGLDNRYDWKNSVGPIGNRPYNNNLWNRSSKGDYFQSHGLGYYEYFQFAEDLGAEPIPVLNPGLSCQQKVAELVPMDQLNAYIQDAVDLIEFANGPVDSRWGKVRADMGHPAPFNLKYIGIGNENYGPQYTERLAEFVRVLREKHPEIKIIGSVGGINDKELLEFTDSEVRKMGVDLIDEHYYQSPAWFYDNVNRYDSYDRNGPKIFVGEYAVRSPQTKTNTFENALAEAAYMTSLERNGDVVEMATYAPLLAHKDAFQWTPDLIWFDNLGLVLTPSYYVQKLFGNNLGTHLLPITIGGQQLSGQNGLYASANYDEKSAEKIIKIINTNSDSVPVTIDIDGTGTRQATMSILTADSLKAENTFENPNRVVPIVKEVTVSRGKLNLVLDPISVNLIRFKK